MWLFLLEKFGGFHICYSGFCLWFEGFLNHVLGLWFEKKGYNKEGEFDPNIEIEKISSSNEEQDLET